MGRRTKEEIAKIKEEVKRRVEVLDKLRKEEVEKWAIIDAQIICRFNFEPRMSQHNNSKWIVVWDRYKKRYVRSEKNKREYKTFADSASAIVWLKAKYTGGKEIE
jgi:hypothetical protein